MNRYQKGLEIRETIIGRETSQMLTESLANIAPILDEYTFRTFEEFDSRSQLDMKQREMITIASLFNSRGYGTTVAYTHSSRIKCRFEA